MHMAIDKSRQDRHPSYIRRLCASWDGNLSVGADGGNVSGLNDDGHSFLSVSKPIDEMHVTQRDTGRHRLVFYRNGDDDSSHDVVQLEVASWTVGMSIVAIDAGLGNGNIGIDRLKRTLATGLNEARIWL